PPARPCRRTPWGSRGATGRRRPPPPPREFGTPLPRACTFRLSSVLPSFIDRPSAELRVGEPSRGPVGGVLHDQEWPRAELPVRSTNVSQFSCRLFVPVIP